MERSQTNKSWFVSIKPFTWHCHCFVPHCGVEERPRAVLSVCGTRKASREDGIVGGGQHRNTQHPCENLWQREHKATSLEMTRKGRSLQL